VTSYGNAYSNHWVWRILISFAEEKYDRLTTVTLEDSTGKSLEVKPRTMDSP
jgi:hypothetical protein